MDNKNDKDTGETCACGPGCGCGTPGSAGKGRYVAGVVILLIAGVLVVRSMVKHNGTESAQSVSAGFAALPAASSSDGDSSGAIVGETDSIVEITALSDLNGVAADTFGVFVFVPGSGENAGKAPIAQMRSATQTIEPRLRGGRIGIFALKAGSSDHTLVASQMTLPGVLALVKGGGMSATSGDITETKLVQALVAAASAGGCGPSGCGPRGCN